MLPLGNWMDWCATKVVGSISPFDVLILHQVIFSLGQGT
jgi:hypothetical protein